MVSAFFWHQPCSTEGGTSASQGEPWQILVSLNMHCVNTPEEMIATAKDRFDAQGNLVDPKAVDLIRQLLQGLKHWTVRLQPERVGAP